MKKSRAVVDPDPFTLAVGVAGIVGGLAGAVSLYRTAVRMPMRRSHREAVKTLNEAYMILDEMERRVVEMEELVRDALVLKLSPVPLGPTVALVPAQFRQYARNAEWTVSRLRQLLKATHRLERRVPLLPYVHRESTRDLINVQERIDQLLRRDDRTGGVSLEQLRHVLTGTRELVKQLLFDLTGESAE